jgi:hypothetical protein
VEALLNNTWRPALAVTGVDGMPAVVDAGNVLRPEDLGEALAAPAAHRPTRTAPAAGKQVLEADPPYGARVTYDAGERPGTGWNAPRWRTGCATRWLAPPRAVRAPADVRRHRRLDPVHEHAGRSVPRAQFLVTGVMGPAPTRTDPTSSSICRPG